MAGNDEHARVNGAFAPSGVISDSPSYEEMLLHYVDGIGRILYVIDKRVEAALHAAAEVEDRRMKFEADALSGIREINGTLYRIAEILERGK